MEYTGEGVPFSFFCSLVRKISEVQPTMPNTKKKPRQSSTCLDYPALRLFKEWAEALPKKFSPLPPNTTSIFFRLLFPEEDVRRKYDIQETRMTALVADCYGLNKNLSEPSGQEAASGCLGQELKIILERSCSHLDGFISEVSIAEIDEFLDELAANSGYSHRSVRSKHPKSSRRGRSAIMQSLFRKLSPLDASVLTQIILKDLRPLLYPLSEWHYSTALTKLNSASVKMLTMEHAMNAWDPSKAMLRFYRVRCDIDQAAAFVDQPEHTRSRIGPTLGSMIAVPKSEKGLSCEHALSFFDSGIVWAENKYDGERAQIHVALEGDGSSSITIFSKSKRDSTLDRHALHGIIRQALGLDKRRSEDLHDKRGVRKNVILDAEMVAFRGTKIEEFWHIRRLIENTAEGIRYRGINTNSESKVLGKRKAMEPEIEEGGLHLGLVFFDVLYLDSTSLLYQTYKSRREVLESIVHPEPGKAILARRFPIDMSKNPESELRHIFSYTISDYQEGLVLKGEKSTYNDFRNPWVKLKKDYIPDCGDKIELLILGARWEKVRGRTLRVPPTTFTTFYVGALDVEKQQSQNLPHFHVHFTVSYGLSRKDLEELNFLIKNSETSPYTSLDKNNFPHTLFILKGLQSPAIVLKTPLVASLMGAGYTKARDSEHYELRFPRLLRVYRNKERDWRNVIDLQSLDDIARRSVGKDRPEKADRDWANITFGKQASPGMNCASKRHSTADFWNEKLKGLRKTPAALDSPPPDWKEYEEETSLLPLSVKTNFVDSVTTSPEVISATHVRSATRASKSPTRPKIMKNNEPVKEGYYVYFQRAEEGAVPTCKWYASFKKRCIDCQVQSVETLLNCCGWNGERMKGVKQGMIVIHECIGDASKQIKTAVEIVERSGRRKEGRAEIVVYTCQKNRIVLS